MLCNVLTIQDEEFCGLTGNMNKEGTHHLVGLRTDTAPKLTWGKIQLFYKSPKQSLRNCLNLDIVIHQKKNYCWTDDFKSQLKVSNCSATRLKTTLQLVRYLFSPINT